MNSWDVMRNNCDAEEETGHDQAQAEEQEEVQQETAQRSNRTRTGTLLYFALSLTLKICNVGKEPLRSKRIRTSKRSRRQRETNLPDTTNTGWVQCDNCNKWRMLPSDVNVATLPAQW